MQYKKLWSRCTRASGDPICQGHGTARLRVDIDDGKLAHAKRVGAYLVINAKTGDPAATLIKETGGGAHGVLITAPSLGAFKQGVGMTRKRGTCVLVGLPPGEFPVPLFDVVANCITIRGSFVGTRQDMAEALAFAIDGKVKADVELQPLSSINQIFDRSPAVCGRGSCAITSTPKIPSHRCCASTPRPRALR